MSKIENNLNISVSKNGPFAVVSLVGVINGSTLESFEKSVNEIKDEVVNGTLKYLLLNFQQLEKLDNTGVSVFHRIKKISKDGGATLKACCIQTEIRKNLLSNGVFGLSEMFDSLESGLQSFKTK